MNKISDIDYEEFKKAKDPWDYIEAKTIEMVSKQMNVGKERVRLAMEQSKNNNILGHALKHARQRKRITVKNMAQRLNVEEKRIKDIESGNVSGFPIGFISSYFNELGYMLSFNILDFSKKRGNRGN